MNQYERFGDPNATNLATVGITNQPAMAQPAPAQMQMALPPNITCAMSPYPVSVQCPFCQFTTTTSLDREVGFRAKMTACALTMSGCCCLLPLCWDKLKDTVHYCAHCQKEIGRFVGSQGTSGRTRQR